MIDAVPTNDAVNTRLSRASSRAQAVWRRRDREDCEGRTLDTLQLLVSQMQEELTQALAREKQARHLAFHDDLTALPNRRYFRQRLDGALTAARGSDAALAVIYLDLDGFKALNDAHGHVMGDRLLGLIAARLSRAVRAEDVVSRLGGDEFACLIFGVNEPERLRRIAASLEKAVSTPFTLGKQLLTVHPSIGIATYPADGSTSDVLLHAADTAMYFAKRGKSACAQRQ
jgi:diguanylate cyclase (GGDEF)-like protein